ncbi:hypothetical protein GYMLUDRAFT_45149 [Collybiopsis luxurians FD-317 M1]|uniref:Unplaced genomic scaffold GYMLUscaffold_36, whole genome shotgun sequence n=1 Tax=Collybiopsis luxurians FD-317 M1 TaxID=944289 RepID=A0A0D0C7T2_9AGAR|nr:hypothetical protein GYMLUDRAFT_45149 [Collybiopsis luxurians FD-317 M1]
MDPRHMAVWLENPLMEILNNHPTSSSHAADPFFDRIGDRVELFPKKFDVIFPKMLMNLMTMNISSCSVESG